MNKDIIFFYGNQKNGINIFIDVNKKRFLQGKTEKSYANKYKQKNIGGTVVLLVAAVSFLDSTLILEQYLDILLIMIASMLLGFIMYRLLKVDTNIKMEQLSEVILQKKEVDSIIKIKNLTLIKGIVFFIVLLLMISFLIIVKKNIIYLILLTLFSFGFGIWLKIYSIFLKEKKLIKNYF